MAHKEVEEKAPDSQTEPETVESAATSRREGNVDGDGEPERHNERVRCIRKAAGPKIESFEINRKSLRHKMPRTTFGGDFGRETEWN